MAPSSGGLAALGQHDVVMPPQLILRDTFRASIGLTTVLQQQQPQSQMFSQTYANNAMGPPQVHFVFQS